MVAALSLASPADQARALRNLADRVEKGEHTVSTALAEFLAAEAEDAEVEAIADRVMADHASILAALAK